MVKNKLFGKKSKILVKNKNFGQQQKFWSKIKILVKNKNFGQKSTKLKKLSIFNSWRRRDCHGKIVEKTVKYTLGQNEVENVARFIYSEITKDRNSTEKWNLSETEFYYFIAHLIFTKLDSGSLRQYAG